jgi:predicted dehydrogenase
MSDSRLRIGVIGLGRMGQNHVRVLSLLKSTEIGFVYDIDRERSAQVGQSAGVPVADELETALSQVDAVVIASPTISHEQYVRLAADHVKRIFVEKPLTQSLESSRAIMAFAAAKSLELQVGFIERFNPAVAELKRLLDNSAAVISVDFVRTNRLSSRITDVDVVVDLMIHDVDLALHLSGPAKEVVARGAARHGTIELASAMLHHENGRLSRILASRVTDKKMRTIQASCGDMFVDCELLRKEIRVSRQTEVMNRPGEHYRITGVEEILEVPPQEALLCELQAFIANATGEAPAGTPGAAEAVAAMEICEQVQRAILA